MKAAADCVACFSKQALQATRMVTDDQAVAERVSRRVASFIAEDDWQRDPLTIANTVHGIVKEETGSVDPYLAVKRRSNEIALALVPTLRSKVADSDDPLATATRLAIAGNIIDYGTGKTDHDLDGTIDHVLTTQLAIDDSASLFARLVDCRHLVMLLDNSGEIVFDRLFLEAVLERHPISRIDLVVKAGPLINDATRQDAIEAGLDEVPGVSFIELGIGTGGGLDRHGSEFAAILDDADLVISKGQGNWEAHGARTDTYFLLMAKCPVVAADIGVSVGDVVLKHT